MAAHPFWRRPVWITLLALTWRIHLADFELSLFDHATVSFVGSVLLKRVLARAAVLAAASLRVTILISRRGKLLRAAAATVGRIHRVLRGRILARRFDIRTLCFCHNVPVGTSLAGGAKSVLAHRRHAPLEGLAVSPRRVRA